jgi:hypothetical protein
MTKSALTAVLSLLVILVLATPAHARRYRGGGGMGQAGHRTLGLGLILASPTGLSLELRMGPRTGLDLAVGLDAYDDNDFYLHLDYLVYLVNLARGGSLAVPLYLGVGAVFWNGRNDPYKDDTRIGVRVPFGIAFAPRSVPVQFFIEGAVRVLFVDERDCDRCDRTDITGGGGFRVYF